MTIKQRGKDKICSAEFYVDNKPYRFSFNGKKGMPLIISKKDAREKESERRCCINSYGDGSAGILLV